MTTGQVLYKKCPLCAAAPVESQTGGGYRCQACGLTLEDRSILGLFRRGQLGVAKLDRPGYDLVEQYLNQIVLPPGRLKVVIGNMYTDEALAEIARGQVEAIDPVKTVLAQIILEQLGEECFVNVNELRRGHGPPLEGESWYRPRGKAPQNKLEWQDEGNLFCTNQRLVLPSNQFTFIRLDRKIAAVQAFADGVAVQRKGEAHSTYFVDCYPHEAALVAAYVMARVPKVRPQSSSAAA